MSKLKLLKLPLQDKFEQYRQTLNPAEAAALSDFFQELDAHNALPRAERSLLRSDFEKAILYYAESGTPFAAALERLDVTHLGGFYARPPIAWYALDDAAKVYPLSMEHGRMAVFRLSVYLRQTVTPELLQMALSFTIKRFPSFATTLKKGFFWHYLDTAKRRYAIEPESDQPCRPLPVSRSGSQSFRVLYYQNRISVEFFHVLTDGTGGMLFLKTLTAEYLRLTGVDCPPDGSFPDPDGLVPAGELQNEFPRADLTGKASGFMDKSAVQLSGRLSHNKPCRVLHFNLDALQLRAAAKRCDATVTAYVLALLFVAGKAATDELSGDMAIQVPVNMRKFYASNTVRNFALYCTVRLPVETLTQPGALVGEISRQLQTKAAKPAMDEMMTSTEKLVDGLRYIPLVIKAPVAKVVYGFLGDKVLTNTLSNLGVITLPEAMARQVDHFDFVLGTAITNRVSCSMVTFENTATLSVAKLTADPSFEEMLYRLLLADGVTVRVEGSALDEG